MCNGPGIGVEVSISDTDTNAPGAQVEFSSKLVKQSSLAKSKLCVQGKTDIKQLTLQMVRQREEGDSVSS